MAGMVDKRGGRAVDRALVGLEALVGLAVVGAIVGQSYGAASTTLFLTCGVAAAFSGWVLVRMFQSLRDPSLEMTGRLEDEERERLEHEKRLLLQGIKELEADFAFGKVDAEDYQHLRGSAEHKALQIISKLKESDAYWLKEAERLISSRLGLQPGSPIPASTPRTPATSDPASWPAQSKAERQARPVFAAIFDDRPIRLEAQEGKLCCAACQTPGSAEDRYCSGCGRPLLKEAA